MRKKGAALRAVQDELQEEKESPLTGAGKPGKGEQATPPRLHPRPAQIHP
jgi:hypothetical protein